MMPDQPQLPGMEPAPRPDHHLFFAVLADAEAARQAERVRDEEMALHQLAGSKVRTERFHVTL